MNQNKLEIDENLNQIDFILIQDDFLECQNRKFYKLQLLVSKQQKDDWFVFTRWGRLGYQGQYALQGPMPKEQAVKKYDDKFKQKNLLYNEEHKES